MPDRRKPAAKPATRIRSAATSKTAKKTTSRRKKPEKAYRSIAEVRREFYPDGDESRPSRDWTRSTESVLGVRPHRGPEL